MNFVYEEYKFQGNSGGNKRKYNDFFNNGNKYKKIKTCYNCWKNGNL